MCVLQEANDCRRPRQSSVRKTRMREREHLLRVRVCFVESATGRSIWLTLFDQCMAGLLDVGAKDFSLMHESMQMYKLNTLVGTRVSLTIKKSKRNGYNNYNVTHLDVLH